MKIQENQKKQIKEESCLFKFPILGYILRKIRKNREAIRTALKTGKEIEGEVKRRRFLGIFKIVSGKRFKPLKLKKEKVKKWWLKPKQK